MTTTEKRKAGRPRKIIATPVSEQPQTVAPVEPPAPARPETYQTAYQPGEAPTACRACKSSESRVLRTTERVGIVWRRRQCKDCGAVWMSRASA